MSANASIVIADLDFDGIKNNLKDFLRSQSKFQDFDFEGSGMNVLLDILALNTHYNAYYLNMVGNEMFLDTSKIRQSTVSHAKMINYVPESVHGAEAIINLLVTPSQVEDQETNILTLDKYTRFVGSDIDGINYSFVTVNSNTVAKTGNSFTFANVVIKQGDVVTRQYLMTPTNTKRRFEIDSSNVDTNTLMVTVQESAGNTLTTAYKQAEDLTEITSNSAVYFLEENEKGNYTIYFGDNILGIKPKDGNIINVTYLETVGSIGNKINTFSIVQSVGGIYNDNVAISSWGSSYSGTDKETIDQIKYRAPYFYTTQNRAVTESDYETLLLKDYPNIDSISVWGGENNEPPVYGKVYLSLKTKSNFFLTNIEKESIKENLIRNRNIITVTPEIVDPDFAYIIVRGKINYNPSMTVKTADEIMTFAKAAISDYVTDELNTFRSTFRKSKLQSYIEASEPSIVGSDISVYVQKRLELDTTKTKSYNIEYNLKLRKGDYNISLYTVPQISTLDVNGNTRLVNFEEKPLSATGIDSITVTNPGINYFTRPTIVINGDGNGATAEAVVRGGKITNINVTNRGSNYTRAEIIILSSDGREGSAVARLESRFGIIRTFFFRNNGERVVLNDNAGTIDYETGLVTINPIFTSGTPANQFYDTNVVTFNFPVEREIILPLRNRILTIDENDPQAIQLEIVAET